MFELSTPGQYMSTRHFTELLRRVDAHETAEILQVALVGTPGAWIVEVGKPFCRRWYLGQTLEFGGG